MGRSSSGPLSIQMLVEYQHDAKATSGRRATEAASEKTPIEETEAWRIYQQQLAALGQRTGSAHRQMTTGGLRVARA